MADHKEAVQVSIAATDDQSEFSAWVHSWWKLGAAVLLVWAGVLIALQYMEDSRVTQDASAWQALNEAMPVGRQGGFTSSDADALSVVADSESANISGPWARYLEASIRGLGGDDVGCVAALAKLAKDHPDHPLNTLRASFPDQATPLTVVERMLHSVENQAAWESEHPSLFDNPAPTEGAPSVRIITTEGPIVVALYHDQAPKHVENFLKLCREGFYNDTRFHRVIAGFMVQGGDPNSREADVDQWGSGGPGYKVDREENDLRHFAGYLAAAKVGGETESSGSQFYFTTGTPHYLDGQHVVFGKVLEGMDTVGIIESSLIVPGTDRPETPATITSTEVF